MRSISAMILALALAVALGLSAPPVIASADGGWTPTTGPTIAQYGATLTALADGRVLLAGGDAIDNSRKYPPPPEPAITTSYLFVPSSASWQRTTAMPEPHSEAAAVRLPDGRVLVIGGYSDNQGTVTAKTAAFDPRTATWRDVASMFYPRAQATATVLLDGQVLVTGGIDRQSGRSVTATAELFDPASGRWTLAAPMPTPRSGQAAALLADGQVLVVGGFDGKKTLASAALYDPARNAWTVVQSMAVARYSPSLVAITDGRVLVVGGDAPDQQATEQGNVSVQPGSVTETAQIFSEKILSWVSVQSPPSQGQEGVTGSGGFKMPDGSVLILESGNGFAQGLIYQPAIDRWSVTPIINTYGANAVRAVELTDGRLLVVAGDHAAFYVFAASVAASNNVNLLASGSTSVALTGIALLLAVLLGMQRLSARIVQPR